jgi:hypothetical protein
MATKKDQIKVILLELLESAGEAGMQYAQLVGSVSTELPEVSVNTIHGSLWDLLRKKRLAEIEQPATGLYRLKKFGEESVAPPIKVKPTNLEADFYEGFKGYLESGPEGCTMVVVVGGNKFGSKWGTPDVVGRVSPDRTDLIQFQDVIISAEIKLDASELITAFGQACAYKLFSHKSYLVIPRSSRPEEPDMAFVNDNLTKIKDELFGR